MPTVETVESVLEFLTACYGLFLFIVIYELLRICVLWAWERFR